MTRTAISRIESLERRLVMSAIHVNAGGAELLDSRGRLFSADAGFTGGGAVQVAAYDVARTENDALFHSQREGAAFSFARSVDNGNYALFLEFADAASSGAGQRVFDVAVEGQPSLSNYDIFASVGQGAADARCVDVTISDGQLNIAFNADIGLACISAIVLVPTDVPESAQPYSWDGLTEAERTALSATNLETIGSALYMYANDHRGALPPNLTTIQEYLLEALAHSVFASPRTDTSLPRGELADVERIAWGAARNDVVYIRYPRTSDLDENTPWVYENPNRVNDGVNVLFGDGHVQMLSRSAAAALIGFPDVPPTDPPVRPTVGPADPDILASQANLRTIRTGLQYWRNSYQGRYPANPGALLGFGPPTTAEDFISPRTNTTPPPADWTTIQKEVWVDTHSDYAYLGNRTSATRFSGYDILMFERPEGLTGGVNILFGDGSVEFRELAWFEETLAHQLPPTSNPPWMFEHSTGYTLSAQTLTVTGGVSLIGDIASLNPGMNVIVAEGATLSIQAGQHLASLVVDGHVVLPDTFGNSTRRLRVGSLTIGQAGKIDLFHNDLLVDYTKTSPRAAIQSAINLARNGGDWLGTSGIGIGSGGWNRTLGVLEASEFRSIDPANTHFKGEPLPANSVLVTNTYYGDADFNGVVDLADYARIDSGFHNNRTGWLNGDFDGNGVINFDDYALIDFAFNTQEAWRIGQQITPAQPPSPTSQAARP